MMFVNVNDLLAVRKTLMPIAEKNKKNVNAMDTYAEVARYTSCPHRLCFLCYRS
jgi:DNA polymerase epsilon subunit 1